MATYRIYLLVFSLVLSGLLSVNSGAGEYQGRPLTNKQPAAASNAKSGQRHAKTVVNKAITTVKAVHNGVGSDPAKKDEFEKPLDLSIPFANIDKSDRSGRLNTDNSFQKATIFATENKKKTRPLQLNGRFIMSPEPEAEKLKSADGAGIVINFKP